MISRLPALMLLIGGIVLMQTHAMDYWSQYDQTTGWLWSLVIEGAAIWLWSARNGFKNTVAFLATLLALSAPLYQLAAPVLESQRSSEQAADNLPDRISGKEAEIKQLETDLATYNKNSETRGGWFPLIETTKADLKAARKELEKLQTEQRTAQPADWQAWLQIGTQGLALIIIQCLIVLTTRTVFAPLPTEQQRTETAAPAAGEHPGLGWAKVSRLFHLEKRHATPKNQRLSGVA